MSRFAVQPCVVAVLIYVGAVAEAGGQELTAHWALARDGHDAAGAHHAAPAGPIAFGQPGPRPDLPAAAFDGRHVALTVPAARAPQVAAEDFTVAAWVEIDVVGDDVTGDLINKYDAAARRGFHLGVVTNAAATSAQANRRQVQFGIRAGQEELPWRDHGRPGAAIYIFALATFNGDLYCTTCEPGPDQAGHVYRLADGGWLDCGRLDGANAITSLAEYRGQLYAATAKYRLRGSALAESPNETSGGRVYRLVEPGRWEECGQVGPTEGINSLVVYCDQLYASSLYSPGFYRWEGGANWTSLGTADNKRVEALTVYNGALFATSYDGGDVHRYTPDGGWKIVGHLDDNTQTYGFVIYEGGLYVGTWPSGCVYRYEGDDRWTNVGRLGEEKEVMASALYNGHLYAGTLPLAAVFRYDAPNAWTDVGRLDLTPDVTYRRVWSMAVYRGRLFAGLLPSGRVMSTSAGACATIDRELTSGWHHLTGVRRGARLELYLDGQLAGQSTEFAAEEYDLTNDAPLEIGRGRHDWLRGNLCDVRLYRGALSPKAIAELSARP